MIISRETVRILINISCNLITLTKNSAFLDLQPSSNAQYDIN